MESLVESRSAAERLVADHHPTGISTGFLTDLRGDWPQLVEEAESFSLFAAELSALSRAELGPLISYLDQRESLPFRYLSVHGPSKDLDDDERALVSELQQLLPVADSIVMHPDTIGDAALFRGLGTTLVIENMDRRKGFGRWVDELDQLFGELPEAGFCIDVAHVWSVDESMVLAHELLDAFGSRLRQVHLSSLSAESRHIPVSADHAELFAPVLKRCVDVPWILEAPPNES